MAKNDVITQRIRDKQLKLRKTLWPELDENRLWLRKRQDGFTTIPRTMPLMLKIMDGMSKGKPISFTYLELWCRAFDECFVTLNNQPVVAFHSGFSGQRALQTWRDRIHILSDLGFIDIKPGPSGEISYLLIFNPYEVIKKHYENNQPGIPKDMYITLSARAIEIGANDLE